MIDPVVHAVCCPTGIGKTTEVIRKAAEVKPSKLLYTVSTHRLGDILKDDQFAKGGLKAKVYRGRTAPDPDKHNPNLDPKDPKQERMCLNLEQVELAIEAGLDVSSTCCIKKTKKGAEQRCKFNPACGPKCGWQEQFLGDEPDVWVSAHEMTLPSAEGFGDIAGVIIDEDFWQDGMRIAERGVLLGDMESVTRHISKRLNSKDTAACWWRHVAPLGP